MTNFLQKIHFFVFCVKLSHILILGHFWRLESLARNRVGLFGFDYVGTGLDFRFPTAVMEKCSEIIAGGGFLEADLVAFLLQLFKSSSLKCFIR